MRELEARFQAVVERPRQSAQMVLLCGPLSRETALLSKKVGAAAEKRAAARCEKVKFHFVDCRTVRSLAAVFNEALRSLGHVRPQRRPNPAGVFQRFLETVHEEEVHVILALGDFDLLVESDPTALPTMLSLSKTSRSRQAFSCILTSKSLDYLKHVQQSAKSLPEKAVVLEPYSAEQLYDILLSRSKQAFRDGAVDDGSLQMAAELASIRGDAGYAVELLYAAGKFAQRAGAERVSPLHVELAHDYLARHVDCELDGF